MARTASRMYVPLDVGFFDDEKIVAAGEKAAFLFLAMLSKAKLLDTDGTLTRGQIAKLALPGWQARLKALLEPGIDGSVLVVELPMQRDVYFVPAWYKWNESKDDRADRHRRDRDRKASTKAATT
jgi:hypothetical protein